MLYRKLGRTGLDVGVVGLGLEHLLEKEEAVVCQTIQRAVEGGVNYVDCLSHNPANWTKLGNALQRYRDQVIITYLASPEQSIEDNAEGFDVFRAQVRRASVDVFIIACCDRVPLYERVVTDNGLLALAKKLQGEGKIRFIGFSTHVSDVAFRVIRSGLFDVLMYPVNPAFDVVSDEERYVADDLGHLWEAAYHHRTDDAQPKDLVRKSVLRACETQEIGLVAMKPFAAGWLFRPDLNAGFTPVHLVAYALAQPGVSTVVPGCAHPDEVDQVLAYLDSSAAERDFGGVVSRSRWSVHGTCLYCSHCLPCTSDIDIAAVNRLVDSLGGRSTIDVVKREYGALAHRASSCVECGECESKCPFGVAVMEKMRVAVRAFES